MIPRTLSSARSLRVLAVTLGLALGPAGAATLPELSPVPHSSRFT